MANLFSCILACMAFSPGVLSLVPFEQLFPFGLENGDSLVAKSDDNFATVELTLRNEFQFFNTSYNRLFVNNNGAISFAIGISQYTPTCAPSTTPMICPFWADVNTEIGGDVFYRESKNASLLLKASKEIQKAYSNFGNLQLGWMFIVTWHDVAFHRARTNCNGLSLRNTFQTILATDGFHSFVLFYYNKITWTTGTASGGNCTGQGGTPAKAGFDFGDSKKFETIPGSCEPEIMQVASTSNFNEPGKWIFRVDESLESTVCSSNIQIKRVRIFPSFISIFGHTPIMIQGPCFENVSKVECHYYDTSKITEPGNISPDKSTAICQVPFLYTSGRIKVEVIATLDNSTEKAYTGYIFTAEPDDKQVTFEIDSNSSVNVAWNPKYFNDLQEDPKLELNLFELEETTWMPRGVLLNKIPNTGIYNGTLHNAALNNLSSTFIVQLRSHLISMKSLGQKRVKRNDLDPAMQLKNYWKNTGEPKFAFSSMRYTSHRKSENFFDKSCDKWYRFDSGSPTDLLPCPPLLQQAVQDSRFEQDTISGSMLQYYHPGADYSFRQRNPSPSGGGQQCVYKNGNILLGPPGGGTADLISPTSFGGVIRHFRADVVPWMKCCKFSRSVSSCAKYFEKRPSDSGHNYIAPQPANGAGDPHITTFDLASYTLNGVGEFWMIKAYYDNFLMQARMEQFIRDDGVRTNASVFTAFSIKERAPFQTEDVHVQISSTLSGIEVLLDGISLNLETDVGSFENISDTIKGSVTYNGISVTQFINPGGNSPRVIISSSFGFSFDITSSEAVTLNIVALASSECKGKTAGLFGIFDGNPENDLTDPDGVVVPLNSSSQCIHNDFGLKWMTTAEESIFIYPPGKNFLTFHNPNFSPTFLTPDISNLPPEVMDACAGSSNCLFDYAITGSFSIAKGTKEIDVHVNKTLEIAAIKISMCQPPKSPQNGFYHAENYFVGSIAQFYCNEGYVLVGLQQLTCNSSGVDGTHTFHDEFPECNKIDNGGEDETNHGTRNQAFYTVSLFTAIVISTFFWKCNE